MQTHHSNIKLSYNLDLLYIYQWDIFFTLVITICWVFHGLTVFSVTCCVSHTESCQNSKPWNQLVFQSTPFILNLSHPKPPLTWLQDSSRSLKIPQDSRKFIFVPFKPQDILSTVKSLSLLSSLYTLWKIISESLSSFLSPTIQFSSYKNCLQLPCSVSRSDFSCLFSFFSFNDWRRCSRILFLVDSVPRLV